MKNLLPDGVEQYWAKHIWDRGVFEKSRLGARFANQRELAVGAIQEYKPNRVLVLCCGVGYEVEEISQYDFVKEVVAIDINPESCEKTRDRVSSSLKVRVINMNVYDIEYKESFDAVVCVDALHHLGKQDFLLQKIHKTLTENGLFIGNYFGMEYFTPWMIKKHGLMKAVLINAKHHIANFLFKLNILPAKLIVAGWMRAFLSTRHDVERQLHRSGFKIEKLISSEWHFFVARKQ